ncbi:MAG: hypothetical protein ACRYGF_15475 [Janthinobacterium lividum]
MLIVAALIAVLIALAVVQVRFYLRQRRLQRTSWDELLSRLQPVNLQGIEEIAENFLHPSKTQLRIEPTEMWELVGKLKGIQALSANADAILDLAVFASRWNQVEGRIVAEMIRRDGVRLKRAVVKIEVSTVFGLYRALAPFQLQEAAAAYQLMRGRLLGLYLVAHVGLHPRLMEVL